MPDGRVKYTYTVQGYFSLNAWTLRISPLFMGVILPDVHHLRPTYIIQWMIFVMFIKLMYIYFKCSISVMLLSNRTSLNVTLIYRKIISNIKEGWINVTKGQVTLFLKIEHKENI